MAAVACIGLRKSSLPDARAAILGGPAIKVDERPCAQSA
jgi:hypothetical protein